VLPDEEPGEGLAAGDGAVVEQHEMQFWSDESAVQMDWHQLLVAVSHVA
jgi:hypothetical protein